jgi:hypothetical protein
LGAEAQQIEKVKRTVKRAPSADQSFIVQFIDTLVASGHMDDMGKIACSLYPKLPFLLLV